MNINFTINKNSRKVLICRRIQTIHIIIFCQKSVFSFQSLTCFFLPFFICIKSGKHHADSLCKKCPYSELFWSANFPHFPAFGLNTERFEVFVFGVILVRIFLVFSRIRIEYGERYSVSLRIQSKCGKMREKCGPEQLRIRTHFTL